MVKVLQFLPNLDKNQQKMTKKVKKCDNCGKKLPKNDSERWYHSKRVCQGCWNYLKNRNFRSTLLNKLVEKNEVK